MNLVIRSNYGDDSIALIEFIRQKQADNPSFKEIYVVYINTGWAAAGWEQRVQQGEAFVQSCGFKPIQLTPKATFAAIVRERKSFPSKKFQWCAGFLKGLPLLEWLDENDLQVQWRIALAKRQALYRQPLTETIEACSYHGERTVWHPILSLADSARDHLLQQAGFSPLHHRSLECQPCVNSRREELISLSPADKAKSLQLEQALQKPLFPQWGALDKMVGYRSGSSSAHRMDAFSMGCGDPFGCGL